MILDGERFPCVLNFQTEIVSDLGQGQIGQNQRPAELNGVGVVGEETGIIVKDDIMTRSPVKQIRIPADSALQPIISSIPVQHIRGVKTSYEVIPRGHFTLQEHAT